MTTHIGRYANRKGEVCRHGYTGDCNLDDICNVRAVVETHDEGSDLFEVDGKGWVINATQGNSVTGIKLPRFAGRKDVTAAEILDECDIVYKPLQGEGAEPRRNLLAKPRISVSPPSDVEDFVVEKDTALLHVLGNESILSESIRALESLGEFLQTTAGDLAEFSAGENMPITATISYKYDTSRFIWAPAGWVKL